jgi:hypothetical protein
MTAKTSRRHGKHQMPRRPQSSAPIRQAAPRDMAEDTGAHRYHTKPARLPQRQSHRIRNGEMNDWIKAGLVLAGIVVAVVIAVHFIGGSGTSTPPTSTNNGGQFQGNPTGPGGGGSQPVIITPSGGG